MASDDQEKKKFLKDKLIPTLKEQLKKAEAELKQLEQQKTTAQGYSYSL